MAASKKPGTYLTSEFIFGILQSQPDRICLRKRKKCFATFIMAMALVMRAESQDTTYLWSGGQPGFYGSITLDAADSPTGGGTLNDIVSLSVDISAAGGERSFTYPESMFNPSAGFTFSGPFTWDAKGIISMSINYVPVAPTFDHVLLGSGELGDYNPSGFTGGINPPILADDSTGTWQATNPINVPDNTSTVWLLGLGLTTLGCWCHRLRIR
jgi:hypothetical protein